MTEFVGLQKLKEIILVYPAISSLKGLEQMPQLKWLEFFGARKLNDVSLIGELLAQNRLPNLGSLWLPKKFKDEQERFRAIIKQRQQ